MYASQADLETRYGADKVRRLTDRTQAGTADPAVVARALSDASAEIDGYLAGRYTLPLASTPAILTRLACDLAWYYLFGERDNDAVRKRYDDSLRVLRDLSKGVITLGMPAGEEPTEKPSGGIAVRARPSVFGNLEQF